MRSVGVFEAKTHLSSLLDAVEQGESIIITRHGRTVARLIPDNAAIRDTFEEVMRELSEIRARAKPGPESVLDLIAEGRRG